MRENLRFEFHIRGKVDIFTISTSVISAGTLAQTMNTLVKMLNVCSFGWTVSTHCGPTGYLLLNQL